MNRWLARVLFSLGPLFLGVFLPYVPLFGFGRAVNLFWGTVYGFGLFVTELLCGNSIASPVVLFGALLWPILVTVFLYVLSRKLVTGTRFRFHLSLALLFLSSFLTVSVGLLRQQPFILIPTYWQLMWVIW